MDEAQKNSFEKNHKRIATFQKLFSSEDGKFILKELEEICSQKKTTFTGDATEILVREGRRQVYLQILHFLDVDLIQLQNMYNERIKDEAV